LKKELIYIFLSDHDKYQPRGFYGPAVASISCALPAESRLLYSKLSRSPGLVDKEGTTVNNWFGTWKTVP
jgi:hypothetical protein